jgi:alginate O-acetyltransferase complex protein AlgI
VAFTSLTFVILLALAFAWHWTFRGGRARLVGLAIANSAFYGWWDWRFLGLFVATALLTHILARVVSAGRGTRTGSAALWLGLVLQFVPLLVFKYAGFGFGVVEEVLSPGLADFLREPIASIVLPVGISFYTFQAAAYLIDVARGTCQPARSALEFYVFLSFFPQLVAGPIERACDLLPQVQRMPEFDAAKAREGLREALWGCFRKIAVADQLGIHVVNPVYRDLADAEPALVVVATMAFAVQIYADFSAYSMIARGVSRLFGIELMRNFRQPYLANSLQDFWRRWHVSLSTWFRDYVFIPLGGSRRGRLRTDLNLVVTFLISGLWHGANWTFVAWGGLHGVAIAIEGRVFGGRDAGGLGRTARVLRWSCMMLVVMLGWALFRAKSIGDFLGACRRLPELLEIGTQWSAIREFARGLDDVLLLLGCVAAVLLHDLGVERGWRPLDRVPRPIRWCGYIALSLFVLSVGREALSGFIYFQF